MCKKSMAVKDWCNKIEMGRGGCKLLALILALVLTSSATAARSGTNHKWSKYIVKTIEVDARDTVDCIDMLKQPAFSHPLLVNHTIQIHPSMGTNTLGSKNGILRSIQSWHKKGHCPHGSIPVKRYHNSTHHFRKRYAPSDQPQAGNTHKYAVITESASAGTIQGIHATLNVWNPTVNDQGFSLSQLWLTAGNYGSDLNTMEAGWQVYPSFYRDTQPRLFIYWTSDGYQSTGCYNLLCSGFVQTSGEVAIGGSLDVSTYDGQQVELDLRIQKDTQKGNWWLYVNGNAIGYWPETLFTSLAEAGDTVEWGGEVTDVSNQMGSGHLPNEGLKKSSYIRGIKYSDTQGTVIQPNPQSVSSIATNPSCYNLRMDTTEELFLFFGGPGCQY